MVQDKVKYQCPFPDCHHAKPTRRERRQHFHDDCVVPRVEIPRAGFSMFLWRANEWSREVDGVLAEIGR